MQIQLPAPTRRGVEYRGQVWYIDGVPMMTDDQRIRVLKHFQLETIEERFPIAYMEFATPELLLDARRNLESAERERMRGCRKPLLARVK